MVSARYAAVKPPRRPLSGRGLTLIELLIVITIIGMLGAMAMPMIGVARRQSQVSQTNDTLEKVNAALQLFKRDVGAYPYYDHAGKDFSERECAERLVYHLALPKSKDKAKRKKLKEYNDDPQGDVDKAYRAYRPDGDHYITEEHIATIKSDSPEWEDPVDKNEGKFPGTRPTYAALLNRLAWERATVAVMSGNVQVKGIKGPGFSGYDKTGSQIVSNPKSLGFGDDYVGDDIDPKRALEGNESSGFWLVDAWKQPLIYICPVTPGVAGGRPNSSMWQADMPIVMTVKSERFGLEPQGRKKTDTFDSDCRIEAHESACFMYELMSRGPDKQAHPRRNDIANSDNLHATGGWRLLQ